MGLLTGLLTLPLAPLRGVGWTIQQLVRAAEEQYSSPEAIRQRLAELEQALQQGLISEDEFDRAEDELLDRLERAAPAQAAGTRPFLADPPGR